MGVVKKGISATMLASGAVVFNFLYAPERDIVVERPSVEYDLREGRVFSDFLKEATWEHYSGPPIETISDIDDIPISIDGPRKYRLTREEMAKVCPFMPEDLSSESAGMRILKSTPKVAKVGERGGTNAVGCTKLSYESSANISEDQMKGGDYFLHFDGFAHKSLNTELKQRSAEAVSNFFSNFTDHTFTAPMHATMVSSTVLMCAGTKTWFFMDPSCCNDFGHHLYSGALYGKGFSPDTKMHVIQTDPGDVLTFGSYHHHMVMTAKGPVFMQTYRHVGKGVIWEGLKKYGWSYVMSFVDLKKTNSGGTANQAADHPLRDHCQNGMTADSKHAIQARIEKMFNMK